MPSRGKCPGNQGTHTILDPFHATYQGIGEHFG